MLVDSHCHLDFPDFASERDDVVARARNAGVRAMLTISTKLSTFAGVREVADSYPDVFCTVGVHPHEADKEEGAKDPRTLAELCRHPKVVGLGKSGLDYYYGHSSRDNQRAAFTAHMEAARDTGLPIVVHSRDANSDTVELLAAQSAKGGLTGLIHCFTGTRLLAEGALDLGFYISFSGIITFKNAEELREIAARVPLERILVETNSPYLAPIPNRGKRNEPAFVVHTAAHLAKLKGISPEELAQATTNNFFRLFAKAPRP